MVKSANERLMAEAVRHRLMLLRYSNSQAMTAIKLLRAANPDIIAQLLKPIDGLTPANMTVQRLRIVARALLGIIKEVYGKIFEQVGAELETFGQHEVDYQYHNLQGAFPMQVLELKPGLVSSASWQQVAATSFNRPMQGLTIAQWFTVKLPTDLANALSREVQNGVLQGKSSVQIINEVRKAGAWGNQERNLATAVHSAIAHVAADARELTAKANEDLIKYRLWLSTLDNRTSPMCIIRDHVLYTMAAPITPIHKNDPEYGAGPGKLHFRCRSVETWVLKSATELGLGDQGDKLSESTRASLDGQVPASMNYRQWLEERASVAVQDEVLGTIRADMLRAGKFKVGDFYDDGKLIPLDKLMQMDRDQRL